MTLTITTITDDQLLTLIDNLSAIRNDDPAYAAAFDKLDAELVRRRL